MRVIILLTQSYFVAFLVLFGFLQEALACDTKWIRLVYMMSCGKKKRESVSTRNSTFSEPLPKDINGVVQYFRERDPNNPYFKDDEKLLYEILEENDENRLMRKVESELGKDWKSNQVPKTNPPRGLLNVEKHPVIVKRLFPHKEQNYLGIPGFPDQWDIEELTDKKINENHRREIDKLIEECCKMTPANNCNGNTFLGACK